MSATSTPESLAMILRALKLPTVARHADEIAHQAERDGWTFGRYLHHLVELEVHERHRGRILRALKASDLPAEKSLATLTRACLPTKVAAMLPALCQGSFVERGDNLLVFGLPGRGKTHLVCAIGHELIQRGHRVLFTPTYALVQRLLAAKRDLRLEKELAILDGFDAVLCDDLGYVQQSRNEMEVLFTFFAERYERRTVIITSNLVFSQWDRIFQDPMTTAAAIDRLVHHAVILEMTGTSIRAEHAHARHPTQEGPQPATSEASPSPPLAVHDHEGATPTTTTSTSTPTKPGEPTQIKNAPTIMPTQSRNPRSGAPTTTTQSRSKNHDHATKGSDGEM